VAAGKELRLETTLDGVELMSETVPAGKSWAVRFNIVIEETDV